MTDDLQDLLVEARKISRTITDPTIRDIILQDLRSALRMAAIAQSVKNQQTKAYQNTTPPPSSVPKISKLKPNKNKEEVDENESIH
ncbi:MAG: hypothetical protein KIS29_09870 [Thermoplasmata archaeon]|nr:hypothetical protein [Candidatus Sysuiplasma jiujiangense]